MAVFEMIEYPKNKYRELYYLNKDFFHKTFNRFWFKNDKNSPVSIGCYFGLALQPICYLDSDLTRGDGAALFIAKRGDITKLKQEVQKTFDGLIRFKLTDNKTDAHVGVFKDLKGREYAGFAIKNINGEMNLPFSNEKNDWYPFAAKEEGTLPWMIQNDIFLDLIPKNILELIELDKKRRVVPKTNEQLLEEVAKIDKALNELDAKQEAINAKKKKLEEKKIGLLTSKTKN